MTENAADTKPRPRCASDVWIPEWGPEHHVTAGENATDTVPPHLTPREAQHYRAAGDCRLLPTHTLPSATVRDTLQQLSETRGECERLRGLIREYIEAYSKLTVGFFDLSLRGREDAMRRVDNARAALRAAVTTNNE